MTVYFEVVSDGQGICPLPKNISRVTPNSRMLEYFPEILARDAASHYYQLIDRDKTDWPLIFILYNENKKEVARYEIGLDFLPLFNPRLIKATWSA